MKKLIVIPVIHVLNKQQVFYNIETCLSLDINQIFLIDHSNYSDPQDLINLGLEVKSEYPNIWCGINPLGVSTDIALSIPELNKGISGLWCDAALSEKNVIENRVFKGKYFGSLAFKYQPQPHDLKLACEEATRSTDVATTSGPGTGKAANLKKIIEIREYLGNHPMAIASGVSEDNIKIYSDLGVDYVLVASSILIPDYSELINPILLEKLLNKLK